MRELGKGGARPCQVWIAELNASEPLMMCRKRTDDVKTRGVVVIPGRVRRVPAYCLGGIRHEGGKNAILALARNAGTCRSDAKGEPQAEVP